jgi:hypothetical protein
MQKKRQAERRKFHFIYKTTCSVNGKYYYGMHSTDDLEDGYLGSGTYLAKAKRKYGKENFKLEIMEFCSDRESLKKREAELITEEMLNDPMCMNLSFGGGEIKLTHEQYVARNKLCNQRLQEKLKTDPETQRKFREHMIAHNKKHNSERNKRTNVARNKARIGIPRTDEVKLKISEGVSGSKNAMFGKIWIFNLDLKISKRVELTELQVHLDNGWFKGRRMFKS